MATLLALTLCAAEMLPASASEEAGSVLQAEDAQAAENIPAETAEIIEELVLPTEIESETESPSEEATKPSEDELIIDLSDAPDSSVIDLSDASGNISDALSEDAVDPWGIALATDTAMAEIPIDPEHFPDEKFRDYVATAEHRVEYEIDGKTTYKKICIDTDKNGSLNANEIAAVREIDVIGKSISILKGIEYFTALTTLQCDNNALTTLDLSKNTKLECLTCSNNQLTALDLKNNTALFSLVCTGNQIQALDLSKNTRLQDLRCAGNQLQTLDFSHNSILTWLDCSQNRLSSLDVSNHKNLCYLFCNDNLLTSLNVRGATTLQWLDCSNNQLETLDVTGVLNVNANQDSAVNLLNCAYNKLTKLSVSNKSYFKGLVCNNNAITELDLSTNPDLRQLECANNELTSLKLPKATSTTSKIKLQTLDCSGNHLTSLDLSSLSITETTVSPNCSGQKFAIAFEQTENGLQINLKELLGTDVNIMCMAEDEYTKSTGNEKSVLGNVIILLPESGVLNGEPMNGNLFFKDDMIPETIRLFYATGYKKRKGEKDVLLELCCHIHDNPIEIEAPTCTQDGSISIYCSSCGYEEKTVLPATGHDYKEDEDRKEPTCEEAGYSKKTCSLCGDIVTTILPAFGHKFVKTEIPPSCTADGSSWEECEVCGLEKESSRQTIPASGHKYQKQEIPPSCTTDGSSWEECEVCGLEKESSRQITPAFGHSYGSYAVTREATIFAEGLKSRACSVCGNVETEIIPKLDGAVQLTAASIPIQIAEKVSVQSLVTGLQKGDCVTSWESDNPEIATISEDGTIIAKKDGTVNISVTTKSGATATMTVQVQKDTVVTEAITGLEKRISLTIGEKLRLKPVLTPISSQEEISYKSSNKKVARVSAKGVIKGLKKGTAKITVSSGSLKFIIKVTVTAPTAQKIKNVPAEKTLRKGKIFLLKPQLTLADSSVRFTFRSSDKKVASVTAKGRIRARRKGVAKITVRAGKLKKVCRIIVK